MKNAITTPEIYRLLSLSIGKEKQVTPYMVAKVFGVAQTTSLGWMRGHKVMDEKNADKAAEWLNLDREFVQLSLEAERKEKAGLSDIAAIFARAAQAIETHGNAAFLALFVFSALPLLGAIADPLCILCKTRHLLFEPPRSGRPRHIPSRFAYFPQPLPL